MKKTILTLALGLSVTANVEATETAFSDLVAQIHLTNNKCAPEILMRDFDMFWEVRKLVFYGSGIANYQLSYDKYQKAANLNPNYCKDVLKDPLLNRFFFE